MFPLPLQKTFRALQNSKLWTSLDLAQLHLVPWGPIILKELWPTWLEKPGQTPSTWKKKSKNKILMSEFLAIIQSTQLNSGRYSQNPAHYRMALFCVFSVYNCCVSEDLIYHLLLGELTSPGGPL